MLLAEAGEAGRVAAGWVRELAARQAEERHRTVLERAAAAVEQAAGREVVPAGEGQLDEELAYDLAAYVVTGSPYAQALPELAMGERIALVAVCAELLMENANLPPRIGKPAGWRGVGQTGAQQGAGAWRPGPLGGCVGVAPAASPGMGTA
ncbi:MULTISPECIES: hypothetical protein [unclassified Kitasatospora]|uniref:hypothetical protein n=1 Tax=unclassified Kitasatospora TaxID=2633591 RepID=UPI0033DB3E38